MNILRHELKMSFRSWLYFTLSMLATLYIFISFFDLFKQDAALLDQILKNFPPEFKAAFGFTDVNLSTVEGYLSFVISYIVLVGAVFGMKQGVSLVSEETRAKTADFLLTKPVKRSQVVTSKLAAGLISIASQNMVFFALGWVLTVLATEAEVNMAVFALFCFSIFFVQLFFIGIGMVIAALVQKLKSVMPVTLGVVFFFFIIELINQSLLDKKLTYLTPFSYFKGSGIIKNQRYEIAYLAVDLAVFLASVLLCYWIYQKKDVHAV